MTVRDPRYGIPLNAEELTSSDPCAVLYGVTPTNKFIPIQIDVDGRLRLGAGVTLDVEGLELGDVGILGEDPDTGTEHELSITSLGDGGWGLKTTLHDATGIGITSTLVSGKQSLDVNVTTPLSISLTIDHTTSNILVYGNDGTNDQKLKTNASGELQVDVGNFPSFPTSIDVSNFPTAATSNVTSKARSNASQTFLVLNASRKGATIYNDSGALLYIKFGAVATSSDFTVRLASQSYYEVPFSYTGRIDGIWASAGAGNALITELV